MNGLNQGAQFDSTIISRRSVIRLTLSLDPSDFNWNHHVLCKQIRLIQKQPANVFFVYFFDHQSSSCGVSFDKKKAAELSLTRRVKNIVTRRLFLTRENRVDYDRREITDSS